MATVQTNDQPKKPASIPNTGALELISLRNSFYQDNYRSMITYTFGMLAIIVILVFLGYYQITHRPSPKYFATTSDGKLIPLIPLDEPNITNNALLQWASEAASNSYTFNFVNYRDALQNARVYFTSSGYQSFLEALKASNNLETVRAKKLVVSAVPTGPAEIKEAGKSSSGVYMWKVQIPMTLSYQSATENFRQNITLIMLVSRINMLESSKGVGISSFIVREGQAP